MMTLDRKNRRREVTITKDDEDLIYVYVLTEPDTYEVRYIGIAQHPDIRLRQHCRKPQAGPVKQWVEQLRERDLQPRMYIVETCKRKHVRLLEEDLILQCLSLGARLLNGGNRCVNSGAEEEADELART